MNRVNHFSKAVVGTVNIADADFTTVAGMDRLRESAVPFFFWLQTLKHPALFTVDEVADATGVTDKRTIAKLREVFNNNGDGNGLELGRFKRVNGGYTYQCSDSVSLTRDPKSGRLHAKFSYFAFPYSQAHRHAGLSWVTTLTYAAILKRLSRSNSSSFYLNPSELMEETQLDRRVVRQSLADLSTRRLVRVNSSTLTILNPNTGEVLRELTRDELAENRIVYDSEGNLTPLGTWFTPENNRLYWSKTLPTLPRYDDEDLSRDQVMLRCPFHDDDSPSLSINIAKGLWTCQSGADCGNGGVIAFEKKLYELHDCEEGTTSRRNAALRVARKMNLKTPPPRHAVTSKHVYHTSDGKPSYRLVRYDDSNSSGSFERYVAGKWKKGLEGLPRLLYNLPAVLKADVVVIVEGEKKADLFGDSVFAFNEETWFAVTTSGGATSWNSTEFAKCLRGKKVLLFHDTDAVGQAYRTNIETDLKNEGIDFRSVEFFTKDFRPTFERIGRQRVLRLAMSDWNEEGSLFWRPLRGQFQKAPPQPSKTKQLDEGISAT